MSANADYLSIILNDTPLFDVRAPIEHSKGCINNAINLPIMSDSEREKVGTCYKKLGQDAALTLGRELVTEQLQQARTQQWLDFSKANPHGLLYCFRGGLRSKISQQWMSESGVNYAFVEGGYKALRRFLLDELELSVKQVPMMLISGRTGSGKTRLLQRLPHIVDLEGLANHRGSSFGAACTAQPSPIDFENAISSALLKHRHGHNNTVFLEDEGRLIGSLTLPTGLKEQMESLSHIALETPLAQRIDYAIEDYIEILLTELLATHNRTEALDILSARHTQSLGRIRKRLGPERYLLAVQLLEKGIKVHREQECTSGYRDFIELILTQYYDPMYDYQLTRKPRPSIFSGTAEQIEQYINQMLVSG